MPKIHCKGDDFMCQRRSATRGLGVLVCALLLSPAAWAQQASGIAGVIRDTSGAVLPGVSVEVTSPALF